MDIENELELYRPSKTIDRVDNNSDISVGLNRARIYFKNGHELSIIRGTGSYGVEVGLFEIMPSDEKFIDKDDYENGAVVGYLTPERVKYYIDKIGNL